jgi:hypothetical protein
VGRDRPTSNDLALGGPSCGVNCRDAIVAITGRTRHLSAISRPRRKSRRWRGVGVQPYCERSLASSRCPAVSPSESGHTQLMALKAYFPSTTSLPFISLAQRSSIVRLQ